MQAQKDWPPAFGGSTHGGTSLAAAGGILQGPQAAAGGERSAPVPSMRARPPGGPGHSQLSHSPGLQARVGRRMECPTGTP